MSDSNSDQPAAEEHAREERQAADGVIQKRSRLIVWLRRALLTGFMLFVLFVGFHLVCQLRRHQCGKGHLV